jgi:hypothetical protein
LKNTYFLITIDRTGTEMIVGNHRSAKWWIRVEGVVATYQIVGGESTRSLDSLPIMKQLSPRNG